MAAENIFTRALSLMSNEDQVVMKAYQERALEVQRRLRQEGGDPTVAIEQVLETVNGSKETLARYDQLVSMLRSNESQTSH